MEARNTVEFANDILSKLNSLPEWEGSLHPLLQMESAVSLKRLREILEALKSKEENLSQDHLQPLIKFLRKRAKASQDKLFHVTVSSHSKINQACMLIDECLSDYLNKPIYTYLLPYTSTFTVNFLKPHQFILSDDGKDVISVAKCLNTAKEKAKQIVCEIKAENADKKVNKKIPLLHTANDNRVLSSNEKSRVIHHSAESLKYYEAIENYINSHNSFFDETYLNAEQSNFEESISQHTYRVKLSDGSRHSDLLSRDQGKEYVKYISQFIKDGSELAENMPIFIPQDRELLIQAIDDDELKRIVLGDDTLPNCVKKTIFTDNERYDKALFFNFLAVYLRTLAAEEDTGYGYSKSDKAAAAKELQAFLCSSRPLAELKAYFQEEGREKFWGALTQSGSRLACVTNKIIELARQLKKQSAAAQAPSSAGDWSLFNKTVKSVSKGLARTTSYLGWGYRRPSN